MEIFLPRKFKAGDLVYPTDYYCPPTKFAKDLYDQVVKEWNRTGCPFKVTRIYSHDFNSI